MPKILLTAYNILLTGLYYLLYPVLLIHFTRIKYLAALKSEGTDSRKGILFHAASVGEVNSIKPLVNKLLAIQTGHRIIITTTSLTGRKQAECIDPRIKAYVSALDVKHLRDRQLNRINPSLICIVETEIWPNMLSWAKQHSIPVVFLNARMSERSLNRYTMIKGIFRDLAAPVRGVYAQSELDSKRFKTLLDCPVQYLGNLKLSVQLPEYDVQELRVLWGYKKDDLIICWGSSRPGEEALIVSLWQELIMQLPKVKLILAPRHPQRIREVVEICKDIDLELWSDVAGKLSPESRQQRKELLIIDTLGMLDKAYAISDLAIIGGSFYDFGGHNPLEAAFYAKTIIIGEYHYSCRDSVAQLLDASAIVVSNKDKLLADIFDLGNAVAKREQMGQRAKKVLTESNKTVDKYLEKIREIMDTP